MTSRKIFDGVGVNVNQMIAAVVAAAAAAAAAFPLYLQRMFVDNTQRRGKG